MADPVPGVKITAFQRSAFQNNAFQIAGPPVPMRREASAYVPGSEWQKFDQDPTIKVGWR